MKFYALSWTLGGPMSWSSSGDRGAIYFAFDTNKERKEWIEDGNSRIAIRASDPELRRILRKAHWVGLDHDINVIK